MKLLSCSYLTSSVLHKTIHVSFQLIFMFFTLVNFALWYSALSSTTLCGGRFGCTDLSSLLIIALVYQSPVGHDNFNIRWTYRMKHFSPSTWIILLRHCCVWQHPFNGIVTTQFFHAYVSPEYSVMFVEVFFLLVTAHTFHFIYDECHFSLLVFKQSAFAYMNTYTKNPYRNFMYLGSKGICCIF